MSLPNLLKIFNSLISSFIKAWYNLIKKMLIRTIKLSESKINCFWSNSTKPLYKKLFKKTNKKINLGDNYQ